MIPKPIRCWRWFSASWAIAAAERKELDWLAEHEVGAAADQPGDVLPMPRLKKNYDGRAFRLLELTLHNAMEEHLANASPQEHIDAHLALGKKFLAENRYGEAERELAEVVSLSPDDPQVHILLAQALEARGQTPGSRGGTSDFTEIERHRGSTPFPGARLSFHESTGAGSLAGTGRAQSRSRQPASGTIHAANPCRSSGGKEDTLSAKILRPVLLLMVILAAALPSHPLRAARPRPRVVEIKLDMMIHQVSAEYVERGIRYANEQNADAILLELNTPGGLVTATQELVQAIYASHAPVITYVAPSGASAASGGFFVLLAGDLAVMAPGTNTGASHPVDLLGGQADKTMSEKIENDLASYIRSIAQKRGRNVTLGGRRGAQERVLHGQGSAGRQAD